MWLHKLLTGLLLKGKNIMSNRLAFKARDALHNGFLYALTAPFVFIVSVFFYCSPISRSPSYYNLGAIDYLIEQLEYSHKWLSRLLSRLYRPRTLDQILSQAMIDARKPYHKEDIRKYYASKGQKLTPAEIRSYTDYYNFMEESKFHLSNLDILPYIFGEFTNKPLLNVHPANDLVRKKRTPLNNDEVEVAARTIKSKKHKENRDD